MRKPPYFAEGEEVIVSSTQCPDLNGRQVIRRRMWVDPLKGVQPGWVYQLVDEDPSKGRWLMEKSLRKVCEPCGLTFSKVIEDVHRGVSMPDPTGGYVTGMYIAPGIQVINKGGLSEKSIELLRQFQKRRKTDGQA